MALEAIARSRLGAADAQRGRAAEHGQCRRNAQRIRQPQSVQRLPHRAVVRAMAGPGVAGGDLAYRDGRSYGQPQPVSPLVRGDVTFVVMPPCRRALRRLRPTASRGWRHTAAKRNLGLTAIRWPSWMFWSRGKTIVLVPRAEGPRVVADNELEIDGRVDGTGRH
jgi:hypothetical protein